MITTGASSDAGGNGMLRKQKTRQRGARSVVAAGNRARVVTCPMQAKAFSRPARAVQPAITRHRGAVCGATEEMRLSIIGLSSYSCKAHAIHAQYKNSISNFKTVRFVFPILILIIATLIYIIRHLAVTYNKCPSQCFLTLLYPFG
jgi:hypothetical protein